MRVSTPRAPDVAPHSTRGEAWQTQTANQAYPQAAFEFDPVTGTVVWTSQAASVEASLPLRGADRLPNGNTLLTVTTTILETTDSGQVVWRFVLEGEMHRGRDGPLLGFYKAERVWRP